MKKQSKNYSRCWVLAGYLLGTCYFSWAPAGYLQELLATCWQLAGSLLVPYRTMAPKFHFWCSDSGDMLGTCWVVAGYLQEHVGHGDVHRLGMQASPHRRAKTRGP